MECCSKSDDGKGCIEQHNGALSAKGWHKKSSMTRTFERRLKVLKTTFATASHMQLKSFVTATLEKRIPEVHFGSSQGTLKTVPSFLSSPEVSDAGFFFGSALSLGASSVEKPE